METQISNEVVKVLNALCDKFGLAVDWSSQNFLPYAEELMGKFINWKIHNAIFFMTIGVILLILCPLMYKAFKKFNKASKNCEFFEDEYYSYLIGQILSVIALIAFIIIGIIMIVHNTYYLIKLQSFPELVLLEYLKNYLN